MASLVAQLASVLGIELRETVSASKRTVVLWAVLAVLAVIAAVFLLTAAYLALAEALGPVIAALVLAASALVIAGLIYAVAAARDRAAARKAALRRQSEVNALATLAAAEVLPSLLRTPLVRDVGLPLGAAALAFFLAHRLDRDDDESNS